MSERPTRPAEPEIIFVGPEEEESEREKWTAERVKAFKERTRRYIDSFHSSLKERLRPSRASLASTFAAKRTFPSLAPVAQRRREFRIMSALVNLSEVKNLKSLARDFNENWEVTPSEFEKYLDAYEEYLLRG